MDFVVLCYKMRYSFISVVENVISGSGSLVSFLKFYDLYRIELLGCMDFVWGVGLFV